MTFPGLAILLTVLAFNLMVTVCVTRSIQTGAVEARMALLNVDDLSVPFGDESAPFRAVDRISYSLKRAKWSGLWVSLAPVSRSVRWRLWG
ncbi:hypothetical protein ACNKHR_14080 [Shigella flexneri]